MDPTTPRTPKERIGNPAARVFLAEDDSEMRGLLAAVLRRDGHEVIEATNGLELLRRVESHGGFAPGPRRDIVVTDVRMPGASGLEVLATLRELRPGVPVVVVTGFGDPETHASAKELGAAAVFDKPFSLTDLVETVLRLAVWGSLLPRPANSNGAT